MGLEVVGMGLEVPMLDFQQLPLGLRYRTYGDPWEIVNASRIPPGPGQGEGGQCAGDMAKAGFRVTVVLQSVCTNGLES